MDEANKETQEQEAQQPPILEQLREYMETRIKLAKYKAIEQGTSIVASVVTDVAIIICLLLTFLFASFTLALFLGHLLHSYWEGFGIVALLYLLIAIVVMKAKRGFQRPIVNALIKKIFSQNK